MHWRQTSTVFAVAWTGWILAACVAGNHFNRRAVVAAALAAPDRPAVDRERDANRHAADLLIFSRVAPGERVLDVGSGGGYFTRLLSSMVGPKGQVAAHDAPAYVKNVTAQREALLASRPNIVGMLTPAPCIASIRSWCAVSSRRRAFGSAPVPACWRIRRTT